MKASKTVIFLPHRAFTFLSYLRPALLAFILISVLFLGGGCTADQIQAAQQQSSQLQTQVATAQQQLADLQKQIAAEKARLTTQPATTQAVEQLAKDEQKAKQISDWLDKAKPVIDQLNAAATAVANGQSPNFTGLGAFGPYGLAGLLLSVGYGVYTTVQKQKQAGVINSQAQTIAAQQPVIDHIQEITGTSNPVSAAAALTAPVQGVSLADVQPKATVVVPGAAGVASPPPPAPAAGAVVAVTPTPPPGV